MVTLATMIALREGLRWATEGAWIQDLPASYQWLGLGPRVYPSSCWLWWPAFRSRSRGGWPTLPPGAVYAIGSSWGARVSPGCTSSG